jgi:perosamine synthetase
MSNLQAAVGLAQLERINYFINLKRKIGDIYSKNLSSIQHLVHLPLKKTSYAENIYWIYGLVINPELKIKSIKFMNYLKSKHIDTRPFFFPMHNQPVFKKMGLFKRVNLPVSEYLSDYGFYIPSGLGINVNEINYVSEQVLNFFRKHLKVL